MSTPVLLPHSDLLQLKRWNTPTIYNGWEQITRRDRTRDAINLEEVRDFMPQMGPMVGYAVTLVIEPGNPAHRSANPNAWSEYRRYVANQPGPKIVVVQDLEKPRHWQLLGRSKFEHPPGPWLRRHDYRWGDS